MVSKQLRLCRGQKGLLRKVRGGGAPQPDLGQLQFVGFGEWIWYDRTNGTRAVKAPELNSTTRGRVAFDLKTVGLLHFASLIEMREEKELRDAVEGNCERDCSLATPISDERGAEARRSSDSGT